MFCAEQTRHKLQKKMTQVKVLGQTLKTFTNVCFLATPTAQLELEGNRRGHFDEDTSCIIPSPAGKVELFHHRSVIRGLTEWLSFLFVFKK